MDFALNEIQQQLKQQARSWLAEKYPLLLKFALRMGQAAGQLATGPTPDASIRFGSFLPADKTQAISMVSSGLQSGAMSTETGVRRLQLGRIGESVQRPDAIPKTTGEFAYSSDMQAAGQAPCSRGRVKQLCRGEHIARTVYTSSDQNLAILQ